MRCHINLCSVMSRSNSPSYAEASVLGVECQYLQYNNRKRRQALYRCSRSCRTRCPNLAIVPCCLFFVTNLTHRFGTAVARRASARDENCDAKLATNMRTTRNTTAVCPLRAGERWSWLSTRRYPAFMLLLITLLPACPRQTLFFVDAD